MTPIFEDVLRALLVGTDVAGTRVFLARAPQVPADQQRTPYLVFFSVGPDSASFDGRAGLGPGRRVPGLDLRAVAVEGARDRRARSNRSSTASRGDYAGVRFGGMFYRSQSSDYESHADIHHVFMTFRILFEFLPEFENFTIHPRKPNAIERRITQ